MTQSLSDEFLDSAPVEDGFRLRGSDMTRIEVFVDAAFAFALTMLVISFDRIPESFDEIVIAIKGIPAFIVAVIQLVWIWHTHSQWSERYGLRDTGTVVLSTALLIIMLIYIYPMRLMFEGMFQFLSGGYFPSTLQLTSVEDVARMFVFLGAGLASVCAVFALMYRHAGTRRDELRLNDDELHLTTTSAFVWTGSVVVCMACIVLALTLPASLLAYAGFGYAFLGVWIPWGFRYRERKRSTTKNT